MLKAGPAIFFVLAALAGDAAQGADVLGQVYDTLSGTLYPQARVELLSDAPREARCDEAARYRLRDIAPGAYRVRLTLPGGETHMGRIVVSPGRPVTLADLDLAKISPPQDDDAY